jgi:hypothetical protein
VDSSPGILTIWIAWVSCCRWGTDARCQGGAPAVQRGESSYTLRGTRVAQTTLLRRCWSPASRETAGRHGGQRGITYNDEVTGSSPGTPPHQTAGQDIQETTASAALASCWGLRAVVGPSGSHARTG